MYSWKSFFCVLVIFVFLVERHSFAIASSSSSSRISPDSLQSSNVASDTHSQDPVIQTVEKGFLKMLGLNSRPKPKKKVHIPAYIMDLYQQAVEANKEIYTPYDSDELSDDLDDVSQGHRSRSKFPFAGTTVRGFYHQGKYMF